MINTVVPYIILQELGPLLLAGTIKTVVQTSSNTLLYVRHFSLEQLQAPGGMCPSLGPMGPRNWLCRCGPAPSPQLGRPRELRWFLACPGGTRTKMTAKPGLWFMKVLFPLVSHPASEGARRILQAAGAGQPGAFLVGPKSRAARLPFADQAPRVLTLEQGVYDRDYRSRPR